MAITDFLHIIYNELEAACKSYEHWKKIEFCFINIVNFLSDFGLRGRLKELVVTDFSTRMMLCNWSIHHGFNWKWEYMLKFLDAL